MTRATPDFDPVLGASYVVETDTRFSIGIAEGISNFLPGGGKGGGGGGKGGGTPPGRGAKSLYDAGAAHKWITERLWRYERFHPSVIIFPDTLLPPFPFDQTGVRRRRRAREAKHRLFLSRLRRRDGFEGNPAATPAPQLLTGGAYPPPYGKKTWRQWRHTPGFTRLLSSLDKPGEPAFNADEILDAIEAMPDFIDNDAALREHLRMKIHARRLRDDDEEFIMMG